MGEKTGKLWALVGEPEGKEPLGRIRRRKKDDIKKNLPEIGLGQELNCSRSEDRQVASFCGSGKETRTP
jgi:hypothetical protein